MIFALYIIVTLLICICLFLSQIVWQNETYHLENKYPNNKVMQKAIEETNQEIHQMLVNYYKNDIFLLSNLIKRNLSEWLK